MHATQCSKVKNPCKICLNQVTNKTGLQCMGACKKWAHFKCLNYTPGKISDIKAGIIKVMCPCPNCDTSAPKEYLTNPPFTCSNQQCPANKPPICQSKDCPIFLTRKVSASNHSLPMAPKVEEMPNPRAPKIPYPPVPKPCPSDYPGPNAPPLGSPPLQSQPSPCPNLAPLASSPRRPQPFPGQPASSPPRQAQPCPPYPVPIATSPPRQSQPCPLCPRSIASSPPRQSQPCPPYPGTIDTTPVRPPRTTPLPPCPPPTRQQPSQQPSAVSPSSQTPGPPPPCLSQQSPGNRPVGNRQYPRQVSRQPLSVRQPGGDRFLCKSTQRSEQDSAVRKPCPAAPCQNPKTASDPSYTIATPMRSPSCSFQSDTGDTGKINRIGSTSDSQVVCKNKYDPMMSTLEDMCNTMTNLTMQMKDLMAKMGY